ncbi:MAG: hypothetical protein HOP07_01905 [Bacteriovoracaceae bacterium]|nr:hypothetical protein [Bacteriovoracaceae bacterium]
MNKLILIVLMATLASCSTMKGSMVLGIGTGAALGGISASAMAQRNKGSAAIQGALVGGAIGGIASYFLHNSLEQRDDRTRRDTLFNLEKFNVSAPSKFQTAPTTNGPGLTVPRVDAQWVETQVQGKKLIEGHRIWVITEDAQWVPNSQRTK